jgi:D-inositol-3-phosphate glycosyltransferase
MNVYIRSVARRLTDQGIEVDIYTRCHGDGGTHVEELDSGARLIRVQAGPCAEVPKEELPQHLPQFLDGVIHHVEAEETHGAHRHSPYDVVHSHYWLSGWVGSRTKKIWGAPHVTSFHTLGKVKNGSLGAGDRPEPSVRLAGEQNVVRRADRILAPTSIEADDLVTLYAADPGRIRVVAPGVDARLFAPRPKEDARARLHLSDDRLLLFVGRLQPFKGPDVAIRALAAAVRMAPEVTAKTILGVVGGPGGPSSGPEEVGRLMELAAASGVADRVLFFPPQPHERLADFYCAADVVLVPSRTESFGLVALEAQACGTPVIATSAGGLKQIVLDGVTGYLVKGHDPDDYARRIIRLLSDPVQAARFGTEAVRHAGRFSWDTTASEVRDVYSELLGAGREAVG